MRLVFYKENMVGSLGSFGGVFTQKASNEIVDQGIMHIVTLNYCVVERDYVGKVEKDQLTIIAPAAFEIVIDVDDVVMVVTQHAYQHKTTARDAENGRELSVSC